MAAAMQPIQLPVSAAEIRDARLRGIFDVTGACIEAVPVWAWPLVLVFVIWSCRRVYVGLIRRWFISRLGHSGFPWV